MTVLRLVSFAIIWVGILANYLPLAAADVDTSGDGVTQESPVPVLEHGHSASFGLAAVAHAWPKRATLMSSYVPSPVAKCRSIDNSILRTVPPVEDCSDVIGKFRALAADITVQLVAGCYHISSGNCTGSVCPHRVGQSTVTGAQAAQRMEDPVLKNCITNGQRGWWIDGANLGIGVYLN
ncbi:hypothetical protein F4778DRAFT_36497 [Xylariomycetidae sp. FL2044]|nr:hypothetical protein F4778DRAFT_36497 [Xylariomycetidae sp. FL2044]